MNSTTKVLQDLEMSITSWRPQPGDAVAGTIVAMSDFDGQYGTYPTVTLDTGGPELVMIHAFHAVLKGELARLKPVLGDTLGIKFLGKVDGKDYQNYRVKLARSTGVDLSPNWGQHAQDAEAELGIERDVEPYDDDAF